MFVGQFQHKIDEKGRIAFPSKYRAALASGVTVTRGLDGCLFVFPKEEWSQLGHRLSALSLGDENARMATRYFFSGASESTPDKQGRILLPAHLREYAELGAKIIVAGMGNRIEFWSQERWANTLDDAEDNIGPVSQLLADMLL